MFGSNSLRSLGPQIRNRLLDDIKTAENLVQFKRLIKTLDGATCRSMYAVEINLADHVFLNNRIRLVIFLANKYFDLK